MLRLAMPALAEEFLVLMVTWTDWWLTGHFFAEDGNAAMTAMSLMGYFMWLVPSMFAAVAIGATAIVARYIGSGDAKYASRTANQAFLVGVAAAVVLFLIVAGFGREFVSAMQVSGEAATFANEYMSIVMFSIPLIMCTQIGAACLRGAGDMVTGFIAKSIVVVLNIAISASLVSGLGPMPEIGWKGLAIGTAVGHCVGGAIILVVLLKGRAGLRLRLKWLKPDFSLISKVLKIGIPGGFDMVVLLFSQMVFLAIINSMGDAAAAAHGLAVQIEACAFLPGAAFQVAAATMSGQFLGARMPDRAKRGTLLCLGAGSTIMCSAAVLVFFWGQGFTYFFTGDWSSPTTIESAGLLKIIASIMPCLAIVMILTGGLRGAGDTIWPFAITAIGFFIVRIPLAVFLSLDEISLPIMTEPISGCGWGIQGAWYAMAIDLVIRSFLVGGRFLHGGWQRIRV